MIVAFYSLFVFLAALTNTMTWAATIIVEGPVSLTRDSEEWAEFSCTVACSHSIDWYVEGHPGDITDTCTTVLNGMMVCKEVVRSCSSVTSTGGYTERLRLQAKPELASSNVAVQCAAVSRSLPTSNNCPPFLVYSRYALLSVRPLPTEPPSTTPALTDPAAAPSPSPSPSPSPVVCPSTTQSVSVSTETLTETKMVTITVTQTMAATPLPDPVISRGTSPSSHLGKVLTGLFSWVLTLLAGLLVL